jgi:hypothetical protein
LLYTVAAFWLRQPQLLTLASARVVVPYAIDVQKSSLASEYYGFALFPGAVIALTFGWWLDGRFDGRRDFP